MLSCSSAPGQRAAVPDESAVTIDRRPRRNQTSAFKAMVAVGGPARSECKYKPSKRLARSERFELPTPRFEVWCSIQLSYERTDPSLAKRPPEAK